jgi:uncharacterized coiled-coil protein SlyX
MFRSLFYSAIVLVFCVMHTGCTGPAHSNGVLASGTQGEGERLKQDNESLRLMMAEKQTAIDKMNIEMTNLKDEVEDLKSELAEMKKESRQSPETKPTSVGKAGGDEGSLRNRTSGLKEETIGIEEKQGEHSISAKEEMKQEVKTGIEKQAVVQTAPIVIKTMPNMLKIKVLSGNGNISSAKALSEKLTQLGYKIENIGMAPRSNFNANTIYFAKDYKKEAQQMAAQLGAGAVFKPLTWSSVFHMIVVAGP